MEKFLIGIDLGTTNTTMAYVALDANEDKPSIHHFSIPQIMAASTEERHYSLPSFIYFPLAEELSASMATVSWDGQRKYCVGVYARDRGAEIPDRMIASAKSWLCHTGIDRRAPVLPLSLQGKEEGLMSPLEACSKFLLHLKEVWNLEISQAPFEKQKVLITVPASFDPSARQLVLEAAQQAGYPEVVLLEEPQAALYSWLYQQGENWRKLLTVGDILLVVDIGGGTTDFTLIRVIDEGGNLALERIAVGAHLLLGGDNIDLALAYLAKNKLEEQGHAIDEWQLQKLIPLCRSAKEKLFETSSTDKIDIGLHGRGSRLVGGTLKTSLERKEVYQLILDGFIPLVDPLDRSLTEKRVGLQQVGLPYVKDPRISAQLAKFLSMTGEQDTTSMDRFIMPTAVLFNGGTMKSSVVQERFIALLNSWGQSTGKGAIKVLPGVDYDLAVSRGAAYYGLVREGKGIRIKGGTSHSYYVGVEKAMPAIPGLSPPLTAFCLVPFGMEEGSSQILDNKEFALTVGELASFRFFSCATPLLSNGQKPQVGMEIKNWQRELTELPSMEVKLDKEENDGKTVLVNLTSQVNELGVLELWCASKDNRKWKLEFDTRSV